MNVCRQQGASLIELVVSITIIAVTLTAAMMLVSTNAGSSSEPLMRAQAISIAQSYMEEILSQPLTDPAGGDSGAAESGETRATYDDVTDYHGLSDTAGVVDQSGAAVSGLAGYNVSVSVADTSLNGDPAKRIAVTVTFDGAPGFAFPLTAYRLN